MRAAMIVLLLLACRERRQPPRLDAEYPVVKQGESVSVTVHWRPGGQVVFSSTRGEFRPGRLELDGNSSATTRFQCFDTDAGPCLGDIRLTARLGDDVVSTTITAMPQLHPDPVGGSPELGVVVRQTRQDGGPGVFSMGGKKWWHWDGGLFDPVPDEPTDFDCAWDGGAHPGYTLPDGFPQALGCDGEPIDVVLFADRGDDSVDLCGTLTLSRPLKVPVYPRATYTLMGQARLNAETCCDRFYCLRDPHQIRYRLRLPVGWRSKFEVGARTRNFGDSLFSPAPFLLEAGTTAGAVLRLPTFEVQPGFRDGDPRPELK